MPRKSNTPQKGEIGARYLYDDEINIDDETVDYEGPVTLMGYVYYQGDKYYHLVTDDGVAFEDQACWIDKFKLEA